MSVAIIFGAAGQDGYYLSNLLQKMQINLVLVSRSKGFINLDISNYAEVEKLIKQTKPDYIFNFAANSTVNHSVIIENNATIVTGTLNILEAAKIYSPQCKIFISGSALQFKNTNEPISELSAFEARDGYSACRIASVYMSRYYRTFGMKIYVGYFFNHDSERRSERHLTKKIANTVKSILAGKSDKLEVGSLNTIKEYTHAQDIVNAVWILVNQDSIFEAVIGSGKGYSVKNWVDLCFKEIGIDSKNFVTEVNGFKPDYNILISNPALIMSLGWKPKVEIEELAKLMLA